MPSALDRSALEQSPLADLHLLANELGVDGFRRLRKAELVDAIIARQEGAVPEGAAPEDAPPEGAAPEGAPPEGAPPEGAAPETAGDVEADGAAVAEEVAAEPVDAEQQPRRGRRGGRRAGGRPRSRSRAEEGAEDRGEDVAEPAAGEDRTVEGVVELLANGSAFVRLSPPETTDDDVYISAAQVKRCELVSGDRVSGPVRRPRRSERFPSLVRVDQINGRPAEEVAEGTRFEDLPVAWPSERLELGGDDPTVKAIEWLTPFGKGSRVTIVGALGSGKTEALRRVAAALAGREGLEVSAVLAGVRPEEIAEWQEGPVAVAGGLTFAASPDVQAQGVEQGLEQARRVAARGGDAVVLIDGLAQIAPAAARRALAAARNIAGGGSLTVIATALAPVGGETTVVALDPVATALGRFPALALALCMVLRPELLVGEAGAEAIRAARAEQIGAPA